MFNARFCPITASPMSPMSAVGCDAMFDCSEKSQEIYWEGKSIGERVRVTSEVLGGCRTRPKVGGSACRLRHRDNDPFAMAQAASYAVGSSSAGEYLYGGPRISTN